ncbi:hypothetical protein V6R21_25340 [Limibacter armeniacum]|uniref:hypothetical protein n=1 Tax=Limibacter armeniacum TaxID=466084 RepID=UPI002FE58894
MKAKLFSMMLAVAVMAGCNQEELTPEQQKGTENMRMAFTELKDGDDHKMVYFFNEKNLLGDLAEEYGSKVEKILDMDVEFEDGNLTINGKMLLENGEEHDFSKTMTKEKMLAFAEQVDSLGNDGVVWNSSLDTEDGKKVERIHIIKHGDGKTIISEDEDIVQVNDGKVKVFVSDGNNHTSEFDNKITAAIEEEYGSKVEQIKNIEINVKNELRTINATALLEDGRTVSKELTYTQEEMRQADGGSKNDKVIFIQKKVEKVKE